MCMKQTNKTWSKKARRVSFIKDESNYQTASSATTFLTAVF